MKRLIALFMCVVALSSLVVAQVPSPPPLTKKETPASTNSAAPANVHELTAVDVEAFLDGLVPLQIKHADIAGARSPW